MILMDYVLFFLMPLTSFLIYCTNSSDIPKCEGFPNFCCPDYKWNIKSQRCEKCLPGYIGINCSYKCPYPSYGEACQAKCDCEKDTCDVSTGCFYEKTECLPGYGGINCTKCPFPYYGEKCQGFCQCSMELCHFSEGCPVASTETRTLSKRVFYTILV
ncbi:platelet endothelial aggregation receptor 1-like [Saccostrea cucullata]|uniref:platelet endothelial aggregation receptor 1-like n=1 Tax=Saccostrea cuccullata TaxID=36930 RepID=UPI002ED0D3F0